MLIQEMEQYAKEYKVPIMQEEGLSFMLDFIKEHNINMKNPEQVIELSNYCMGL